MAIIVKLDSLLAERDVTSEDLAKEIGVMPADIALPTADETTGITFSTLDAICQRLDCQPGDILTYSEKRKVLPFPWAGRFRWVNRL